MAKKRADVLLYEKGLVPSREKGKSIIMSGSVYIGTRRIDKAGEGIDEEEEIYIKGQPLKYVSRGGLKLEKAIEEFELNLSQAVCMDIGASTGGFTDCMLQNGASRVYAVDVGYGQLDWKIRNNEKVIIMDRTNIRNIRPDDIGESLDFISIDVSFISLSLVLPVAKSILKNDGSIVALIKPQFEAGKGRVGKKGIVKDRSIHNEVIEKVIKIGDKLNLYTRKITFSPITGAKGNIEYLILLSNSKDENAEDINNNTISNIIDEAIKNL